MYIQMLAEIAAYTARLVASHKVLGN